MNLSLPDPSICENLALFLGGSQHVNLLLSQPRPGIICPKEEGLRRTAKVSYLITKVDGEPPMQKSPYAHLSCRDSFCCPVRQKRLVSSHSLDKLTPRTPLSQSLSSGSSACHAELVFWQPVAENAPVARCWTARGAAPRKASLRLSIPIARGRSSHPP